MVDEGHGTATAVLNVEQTLADLTTPKTFVGIVDLTNMTTSDITTLNIYMKVLTGGSLILLYSQTFIDAQAQPCSITLPVPSLFEWKLTIKQTGGTGRAYDWTALSL